MERDCFLLLPNRIRLTAVLEIVYEAPTHIPAKMLIEAEMEKVKKIGEYQCYREAAMNVEVAVITAKELLIAQRDACSRNKTIKYFETMLSI